MHNVYIRIVVYVLSSFFAMIPTTWLGFVVYDQTTQMLQISITGLATAIVGGLGVSSLVFGRWGVK